MSALSEFEKLYLRCRGNRWYWLFYIFCRISLAFAFIMAGFVKIIGERFASGLSVIHPMGAYLEALHHTGYYYTFIGYAQIVAAILLLIPRTVLLGALLYFPIILNIWILSFAVRFEGSFFTSPLMVLANLFILLWHYDKLQYLLPLKNKRPLPAFKKPEKYGTKFPFIFALMVLSTMLGILLFQKYGYEVMPRNSLKDCKSQFISTEKESAGFQFCECIHIEGYDLNTCLENYEKAPE